MPTLNHQVQTEAILSYELRMVLTLLLGELNTLRTQAGLPVRTPEQIRVAIRQYMRTHERKA
jgi:hypothetical protein